MGTTASITATPTGPPASTPGHTSTAAGQPRRSVVVGVAGWSVKHPLFAIAGWLLLVAMCVIGGNIAGMHSATDAQLAPGETGRATAMIAAAGLQGDDVESVLITAKSGQPDPQAMHKAAAAATETLNQLPMVKKVAAPVLSGDGSATLAQVTLTAVPEGSEDPKPLQEAVSRIAAAHPDLTVDVTGSQTINADVNDQLGRDFSSALILSLPITLLILLIAFGALLAAGVPVLLGVSAVLSAIGLYTVASHVLPDGGSTAELILLIGMAVGVDYSLFYLKREREERRAGRSGHDALLTAAATAGHSVVVSGGAVMVAMAGLFLLQDINFSGMAVGGIIVVALAVLGSLTVLPAVLGLLGDKVDRPRIPLLSKLTNSDRQPRIWPALLRPALRYPALTLLIAVGGMLLLAWPATNLHLKNSTVADLPQSLPSVAGMNRLTTAFPDQQGELAIVMSGGPTQVATVAHRIEADIASNPGFGSDPDLVSAGRTSLLTVPVPYAEGSTASDGALETMRGSVIPRALVGISGVEVAVGGSIAGNADYVHELSVGAPLVIAFVVLMTFLLMMFTFRSVVVGLVTIAANLLSAAAAFGVLALVFQSQWVPTFWVSISRVG